MPAASPPRWGWHQLDRRWAEEVVASSGVGHGDLVVDVGAGTGALTGPLVARGARVVAFELHRHRADLLRHRFQGLPVTVVEADASDLRPPRRPFRVVANPPFGITTALLRRLLAPGSRLVRADLIVPLPAAQQWASGDAPGAQRWLSLFRAEMTAVLPPSAFHPRPPRRAGLLVIRRR